MRHSFDELNHASIIDGIRLVPKSIERAVYKHSDLADLEAKLKASREACRWGDGRRLQHRRSPTGVIAFAKVEALVADDSHGIGAGKDWPWTPEHAGCFDRWTS
jgi:glycine C-acetyltransferase